MTSVRARFQLPGWGRARPAWLVLVAVLLAGCAGQQLHRDGLALMAEGRVEAGLAKLTEATQAAPDNLPYRADLLRSREQTVNRMLAAAASEQAAGRAARRRNTTRASSRSIPTTAGPGSASRRWKWTGAMRPRWPKRKAG